MSKSQNNEENGNTEDGSFFVGLKGDNAGDSDEEIEENGNADEVRQSMEFLKLRM